MMDYSRVTVSDTEAGIQRPYIAITTPASSLRTGRLQNALQRERYRKSSFLQKEKTCVARCTPYYENSGVPDGAVVWASILEYTVL